MANYICKGTQKEARVIIYSQGRILAKKALTETKDSLRCQKEPFTTKA